MPPVAGFFAGAFGWGIAGATATAWGGAWIAGAGFASTIVGSLTVKLLTSVAISALQMALAPSPSGGGLTINTTLRGENNPETIILGRYATSGQCVYVNSHGKSNRYLTHVVELCSAPGATLSRLMLGDKWVALGTTAHDSYGLPVITDDYDGHVWIKFHDGRQTGADPDLVAKYSADPDMPWDETAIGTGLCYAILTFYYDREDLPQVPSYRFELDGIPLYDIRKDSTAGGTGPQRLANPATWEQTNNPVVMTWNVLRGIPLPGGEIYGGGYDLSLLPTSVWMASMNRCDAPVAIAGGGTEPSYRAGIEAVMTQEPAQPLTEILKACSATIADMGYAWTITVGAPGLPVYSFTDDDVIVSKSQTLDPFPSLSETYNAVSARYPAPKDLYETREAPLRTNGSAEASDAFGRRTASLTLPAAPYGGQVQRLTRAWLNDERRFIRHILNLPPDASAVELTDTMDWTSGRNGYQNKVFSVSEISEDVRTGIRQFSTRERDPSDYGWSQADELPEPPTPTVTPRVAEAVSGFDALGVAIIDNDGQARRPGIQITWDSDLTADGLRWRARFVGQTTIQLQGDTQRLDDGFAIVSEGVLPARSYEVQVRLIKARKTAWSAWKSLTTPSVYIGSGDVSDTFIDEIEDIAEVAGIRTVGSLPAVGDKPNQVVMLVPPGRLYRWDATAGAWTTQLYSGIEPGSLQLAGFAAGIEPVGIITSPTLPTAKTTTTIVFQGKLYRWNGSAYVTSVPATDVTGQLTSAQIASLDAAKLAGQITSSQIGTGAVLNSALADAAVSVAKLADSAVTAAKIADAAVTVAKFASGIRPVEIVSALPTTGNFDGRQAYLTTDKRLYRHNGSTWVNSNAADQIVGQLVAGQIAAGAIGADQIAANAVTATKLVITDMTNLVPDSDLLDAEIWNQTGWSCAPTTWGGAGSAGVLISDLSGLVYNSGKQFPVTPNAEYFLSYEMARRGTSGQARVWGQLEWIHANGTSLGYSATVDSGIVTDSSLRRFNATLTAPATAARARWRWAVVHSDTTAIGVNFWAPTIRLKAGGQLIVDGAITAEKIAANAVTAAAIAAGAITTAKLAAGSITAGIIAADAVTAVHIAAAAVTAGAIAANAVTASTIAASAVTATALAAGSVTTAKIATGAVTANEIAANTITAAKIAAGAIGATEIAAGAILASRLAVADMTNLVPDSDLREAGAWQGGANFTLIPVTDAGNAVLSTGEIRSVIPAGTVICPGLIFPVSSGQDLFWSYQLARIGGSTYRAYAQVQFLDRTGALVVNSVLGSSSTDRTNTSATIVTGAVVVPDGAYQARWRWVVIGANTDAAVRFWAPVIRLRNKGELIVDGAITANKIAADAVTANAIAAGAITATAIAAGSIGATQIAAGAITAAKLAAGSITADKFAAGQIIAGDLIVDGAVSATYTVAVPVSLGISATGSSSDAVGGSVAATFAATQGGADFPSNPVEITLSTFVNPITASNGRVTFILQRLVSGSWTDFTDFDIFHTGAAGHFFWRGLGGNNYSFGVPPSGSYRLRARIRSGPNVTVSNLLMTMRQLNK